VNSLILLAVLAAAQQTLPPFQEMLAGASLPESQPAVNGVLVLKVSAEVKVFAHNGRGVEGSIAQLQKKYGFIPDQTFVPQAVTNDKDFVVLPYDSSPRPMFFLVKGFINETRLQDLARDTMIRKVEQETAVEASAESLHFFVQGYGPALLKVEGVHALSVGAEQQKPVLVITLLADADRDATASLLRKAAPALVLLPHRYERSVKKAEPRFRAQ
jgi:hypothetical protein